MVVIKMKNNTASLRRMTDAHGAGAHLSIAVGGNAETEALTLDQLVICERDVRHNVKAGHVKLSAVLGNQTRVVTYDEAITLLTPPKDVTAPAGFSAPPGAPVEA